MALAQFNLAGSRAHMLARASRILASPYTWVALTTAALIAASSSVSGPGLSQSLGDTDDAVRLLAVREFLAGAPLLDTTLPRIGAPDPLVSHWSRLIDIPLAAMIMLLRPFVGAEQAEWLTRAIWPLMTFVAFALIVGREAQRLAGSWATGIALSLVAIMPLAMVQFRPGRIDHHNVQILCAVCGLLLLRRAMEQPRAGWSAGLLLGLGLAVGYEGIALVVPMLALAGAVVLLVPAVGRGPVHALIAASGTMLAALLVTTPMARITHVACDALSLNLVVLAACSAASLWITSVLRFPLMPRLAFAGVGAGMGALLYAVSEPACLAGPFGQVDPAIGPVWLNHVLETQSFFKFTAENPEAGLPAFVVLAAGLAAQLLLLHRTRTVSVAFAAAATVLAVMLGLWQIKLMPYALWLCIMPIATLASELRADPRTTSHALRGLIGLLLLITFSDTIAHQVFPEKAAAETETVSHLQGQCYRTGNVEKLARLEPGLMAANLDLSAYIAALTPHRVVGAPYHRIPKGILAVDTIFSADPETARATVRALGVRYIATCTSTHESEAARPRKSFRDRLLASQPVAWLQELTPGVESMRVWRVID